MHYVVSYGMSQIPSEPRPGKTGAQPYGLPNNHLVDPPLERKQHYLQFQIGDKPLEINGYAQVVGAPYLYGPGSAVQHAPYL